MSGPGPVLRGAVVTLILPELRELRTRAGAAGRTEGDPSRRLLRRSNAQPSRHFVIAIIGAPSEQAVGGG
jgi:hypothetical protein